MKEKIPVKTVWTRVLYRFLYHEKGVSVTQTLRGGCECIRRKSPFDGYVIVSNGNGD
ncbi:MAG: hypothetical protein MRZ41_01860 [Eubacterium sp.]|nr:hypothetical protein [Eubacterium sp.]